MTREMNDLLLSQGTDLGNWLGQLQAAIAPNGNAGGVPQDQVNQQVKSLMDAYWTMREELTQTGKPQLLNALKMQADGVIATIQNLLGVVHLSDVALENTYIGVFKDIPPIFKD